MTMTEVYNKDDNSLANDNSLTNDNSLDDELWDMFTDLNTNSSERNWSILKFKSAFFPSKMRYFRIF